MAGVIVVDACVLIAYLEVTDAHHARAEAMLLEAVEHQLAASSVTLAEVLVGPTRTGKLATARAGLRDLEIREVPVLEGSAERLARVRFETGLKLPDSCVLLAAEDVSAVAVLTFDDRLTKGARGRGHRLWADTGSGDAGQPEATSR